jgi:hypothetical protein
MASKRMQRMETPGQEVVWHYLGDGTEYVSRVPARDITRDEWDALGQLGPQLELDLQAEVHMRPDLYAPVGDMERAPVEPPTGGPVLTLEPTEAAPEAADEDAPRPKRAR